MNRYAPEGTYMARPENRDMLSSVEALTRAMERGDILEAIAKLCDSSMTLHFELGGIPAIMPKEEVQHVKDGEECKDIAILTRVGKPVCFKVIGFTHLDDGRTAAVLSRRAAQAECAECFISTLVPGDVIPAKITHMENFGAFVDIGCGIVSLLSIDCISVSRISHPSDRFTIGDRINCVIKEIDDEGRIYVSHRELLGTWEENAAFFTPGETVAGIVRSVESYGIFVELTPNLAGLAELKSDVVVGDTAAVYIKSMIPEKMKIKLIIIDHYPADQSKDLQYFLDPISCPHLDHWQYSPIGASKTIETVFNTIE